MNLCCPWGWSYLQRGQKQLPSLWTSLEVVPPAGTALLVTQVVVGREAALFGACMAPMWVVSEPIGSGHLDTVLSVPWHASQPCLSTWWPSRPQVGLVEGWVIPQIGGASGSGSLQPEKSGRVRPSGGATNPDIPATVVLGVVMHPDEAVTPYPGICSTI